MAHAPFACQMALAAAHFTLPQHHIFQRCQPGNAHGAAGVEFVGADAYFSAQAIFKAVGKAGAGIDHAACRIYLAQKALGVRVAGGNDGFGVVR